MLEDQRQKEDITHYKAQRGAIEVGAEKKRRFVFGIWTNARPKPNIRYQNIQKGASTQHEMIAFPAKFSLSLYSTQSLFFLTLLSSPLSLDSLTCAQHQLQSFNGCYTNQS